MIDKKIEFSFIDIDGDPATHSPYINPNDGKYPYLGIDEYSCFVVLFTAPNTGVCLCVACAGETNIGDWSDDWEESAFYMCNTEITISQKTGVGNA